MAAGMAAGEPPTQGRRARTKSARSTAQDGKTSRARKAWTGRTERYEADGPWPSGDPPCLRCGSDRCHVGVRGQGAWVDRYAEEGTGRGSGGNGGDVGVAQGGGGIGRNLLHNSSAPTQRRHRLIRLRSPSTMPEVPPSRKWQRRQQAHKGVHGGWSKSGRPYVNRARSPWAHHLRPHMDMLTRQRSNTSCKHTNGFLAAPGPVEGGRIGSDKGWRAESFRPAPEYHRRQARRPTERDLPLPGVVSARHSIGCGIISGLCGLTAPQI